MTTTRLVIAASGSAALVATQSAIWFSPLRAWWRKRQRRPYDWATECPELLKPGGHVRKVAPHRPAHVDG